MRKICHFMCKPTEILEASDQLMGVIHKIRLMRKQQSGKEKGDKRFLL